MPIIMGGVIASLAASLANEQNMIEQFETEEKNVDDERGEWAEKEHENFIDSFSE